MERSISINGIQLAFTEKGDRATTILLIHGHPFNRSMWRPQIAFLCSRHRVIVPDLRGYGESGIAPHAEDVGHMPNLEQPEAFNSAVSAWLDGLWTT